MIHLMKYVLIRASFPPLCAVWPKFRLMWIFFFFPVEGGLFTTADLLAAGWAQIPWSLIRANIKTYKRLSQFHLKR